MNLKGYTDYRIAIPLAFQEVFSHFYFAENKSGQTVSKTLLPSYQTVLIFNFGPAALLHSQDNAQIALNKCIVLGPIKKLLITLYQTKRRSWWLASKMMRSTVSLATRPSQKIYRWIPMKF